MEEKINTEQMHWSDVKDVYINTSNTKINKSKRTKKTTTTILGAVQLMENFIKDLKQLNVYNSSSIIKSEATWLQKHSFTNIKTKIIKLSKLKMVTFVILITGKHIKENYHIFIMVYVLR